MSALHACGDGDGGSIVVSGSVVQERQMKPPTCQWIGGGSITAARPQRAAAAIAVSQAIIVVVVEAE